MVLIFFLFESEREIDDLHEMLLIFFGGHFFKKRCSNFCQKKLQGKTLCKLVQIFPPKVLAYILHQFLLIPFHKLIEKYLINWLVVEENLKQIKYFCCLLRIYLKIIKMRWDKLVTSLYWLKYQYTRRQWVNIQFISNVLKKISACVFWARFSKSFGGKIRHIWTDATYRMNKEKWCMRSMSARIFVGFFQHKRPLT